MDYTTKRFEELNKTAHERDSFDCGQAELNTFLKTQALKHMKAGISRTMVLPATTTLNQKQPIYSFYTIAGSSIRRETLPDSQAKKLPRYPIPVFLLAQLAVHQDLQSHGLGKITLTKALEHLLEVNTHMPAYAIVVDSLHNEIIGFYEKFGFERLYEHSNGHIRLFLPMKTIANIFSQ
ncbi:GNAT family N-acetyltransferase [Candidatus Albibeggiatoa sp. nov. NOAA]|uniref:GNAT family N-acetyltransferase n=1 Tax=Candidatus Albibeggiatoa sp. nov. NOAA TaxID=3162724 RepID=UPI0032FCEF1A|nr:GNAT family N-acetyltransferase [Thiotrichaceae bacterium]